MNLFVNATRRIVLLLSGFLLFAAVVRAQSAPPDFVRHRLILIGDAGRLRAGKNPVIDAVSKHYSFNDPRTTLLYLGDNLYTYGLEDETGPDYKPQTDVLRYQARRGLAGPALAGVHSRIIFIPGNHDWAQGKPEGWDNIRRQGRWLDSLNAPNIELLPRDGCPGPDEINLSDRTVLVLLDSQWWLHKDAKPGPDNSDCACQTEEAVVARLVDIARRNKDKTIVVATHHPFRSYGIHGGYYTLKQHIFPLTDFSHNLYVPLPVIGSVYPIVRGVFGNVQDLPNPAYKHLIRSVETALADAPNVVFVSGHDHALQHIVDHNRQYIVSGTGINRERVKKGKKAKFVSSDWGYAVLDELASGELKATFYTVDEAANATEAYTTTLFAAAPAMLGATPAPKPAQWPDTVRVAIAPDYDNVGSFHRWLLGNNYRAEWATPVRFPVFDISRTQGGFTVLKRGGGMQTKSLRLEDKTGEEWVLRSVQKDPARALAAPLRATIAKEVLQDQISASNPYGPLVVPVLAQAAHIPHTNPTLMYVPDDPALGVYREDFGGTVCLLERREPIEGKTVSTPKVLDELADDNDNRVDERAVVRARLFDLLIGDWDRHEDQWRWGYRKTEKGKTFYPIPRDRDQVFFKAEGVALAITSSAWLEPKFQKFGTKLANVNGWMNNARYFDRLFLAGLSSQDWIAEINSLLAVMTDSVLEKAVDRLPEAIWQESGRELLIVLKARRGWLMKEGLTYYRFLAKSVDIPGSDKTELFRVAVLDKQRVAVSVFKIAKDGDQRQRLYYRIFDASVTNEIRLYGLKGDDRFEVTGGASPINIRLIGGKGDDVFSVAGNSKKPLIYDRSTEANVLPNSGEARLRLSASKAVNDYNPHAFQYDKLAPLVSAGYNLDDGILLGVGAKWTHHSFRKEPFASQNSLLVSRALATQAMSIKYNGVFTHLIGQNDLWLSANIKAPDNVTNFFGVGNNTEYNKEQGIGYYRTRYNLLNFSALLKRDLSKHVQVVAGAVFQQFGLERDDNEGRFIEQYIAAQPEPGNFLRQEKYAGLQAGLVIDTRNNPLLPARGVYWNTTWLNQWGFNQLSNRYAQLTSDLTVYSRLGTANRVILTNRIGGSMTFGNPAFYQLLYLGGSNLRGFRRNRFAGSEVVYYNLEARIKLFDFQSSLFPGSVGLLAFSDLGRVWSNGEPSKRWHDGYGGGLYMVPAGLAIVTASVGISDEGVQPYISLGIQL